MKKDEGKELSLTRGQLGLLKRWVTFCDPIQAIKLKHHPPDVAMILNELKVVGDPPGFPITEEEVRGEKNAANDSD